MLSVSVPCGATLERINFEVIAQPLGAVGRMAVCAAD